jgi:hypothetical protein
MSGEYILGQCVDFWMIALEDSDNIVRPYQVSA